MPAVHSLSLSVSTNMLVPSCTTTTTADPHLQPFFNSAALLDVLLSGDCVLAAEFVDLCVRFPVVVVAVDPADT